MDVLILATKQCSHRPILERKLQDISFLHAALYGYFRAGTGKVCVK